MAGKTGTAQVNYGKRDGSSLYYVVIRRLFPADKPKYSCIVIMPSTVNNNYYGADVAGPVLKG
jgi:cell division protein FtsI (penicillin-binding protein 3)